MQAWQGHRQTPPANKVGTAEDDLWLLGNVLDDPAATLEARTAEFALATGKKVHVSTICPSPSSQSPPPHPRGGHPRRPPLAPACRSRRRTEALGLCGSVGVLHIKSYLSIFHVCLRSWSEISRLARPRPATQEPRRRPARPRGRVRRAPHTSPTAIPRHPACPIVRCGALGRERAEISPRRAMPSPSKPIAGPG